MPPGNVVHKSRRSRLTDAGLLHAQGNRLTVSTALSPALVGGVIAAGLMLAVVPLRGWSTSGDSIAGACVALQMVEAHGRLDDVLYRRVVRALTSDVNSHRVMFAISYQDMMATCRKRQFEKLDGDAAQVGDGRGAHD